VNQPEKSGNQGTGEDVKREKPTRRKTIEPVRSKKGAEKYDKQEEISRGGDHKAEKSTGKEHLRKKALRQGTKGKPFLIYSKRRKG